MHPTGLFDSPRAQEIRLQFEAAMREGASAYHAGDRVLNLHTTWLNDPEQGPVIFYALAALQMDQGVIDQKVRKRALTYINSGEGLEPWVEAGENVLSGRRGVEQELRRRLVGMG